MNNQFFTGTLCAFALTACATADSPTITADQVVAEQLEFARVDALPATATADMPTSGSATYQGTAEGTFTPDSAVDGFIADFTLTADFSGNTLDGSVSNINAIENGVPDQLIGGTLDIDGTISGASVSGSATGTLTAVRNGLRGSADANFAFDGGFRNDAATADAVAGTVGGRADGEFSVLIQDGSFFATQ